MKKFSVIALSVASLMLATSSALASWHICTPVAIGSSASLNRVKVTNCDSDPTNGKNWLSLDPTSSDKQMATILTAMSLGGKAVSIEVTTNQDSQGYMIADYIILYYE